MRVLEQTHWKVSAATVRLKSWARPQHLARTHAQAGYPQTITAYANFKWRLSLSVVFDHWLYMTDPVALPRPAALIDSILFLN